MIVWDPCIRRDGLPISKQEAHSLPAVRRRLWQGSGGIQGARTSQCVLDVLWKLISSNIGSDELALETNRNSSVQVHMLRTLAIPVHRTTSINIKKCTFRLCCWPTIWIVDPHSTFCRPDTCCECCAVEQSYTVQSHNVRREPYINHVNA